MHYRQSCYCLFHSGDNCYGPRTHYAVLVARVRHPTGPCQTLAEATGSGEGTILVESARWQAPGHNSLITNANSWRN